MNMLLHACWATMVSPGHLPPGLLQEHPLWFPLFQPCLPKVCIQSSSLRDPIKTGLRSCHFPALTKSLSLEDHPAPGSATSLASFSITCPSCILFQPSLSPRAFAQAPAPSGMLFLPHFIQGSAHVLPPHMGFRDRLHEIPSFFQKLPTLSPASGVSNLHTQTHTFSRQEYWRGQGNPLHTHHLPYYIC